MKLSLRQIVYYRALLCISLVIITYLATADFGYAVFPLNYDKINHLATFLVLALLVDFSFPNSRFNSIKIFLYGGTLIIGLHLRFVMRQWTTMFRRLVTEPENKAEIEAVLDRSIRVTRREAYLYWIIIMSIAFLCATKPL